MTEETKEVKKKCGLVVEFLQCLLVAGITLPVLIMLTCGISSLIVVPILLTLLAITFLLSIAWLIRIGLNKGKLKGVQLAREIAIISCLLFMGMYAVFRVPWMEMPNSCAKNIRGIGVSIIIYASDHDDILPAGSNWCDELIEKVDGDPKTFMCEDSGAVHGESSYALNRNLVGKKTLNGSTVVMLFETSLGRGDTERTRIITERPSFGKYPVMNEIFKGNEKVYLDRWNQLGGPEDLTVDNHEGRGCYV
ncbi:hypothetical protein LCGC14_2912460, partial [marine sediment metagenome]